jgi:hypothetical protein
MGTGTSVAAGDAITAAKMNLKLETVDTANITDLAVTAAKLAANAVETAKILDANITTAKLADAAVTAAKLAQPTAEGVTGVAFRVCRASYSFAVDGGAVGTIALLGATSIPANALIVGGALVIGTALTSAGAATAALQVEAANDVVAAAVVSGAPWSTTGRKSIIPAFTGATTLLTTVARDVSLVIGTAALTAGAFDVYLFYIVIG